MLVSCVGASLWRPFSRLASSRENRKAHANLGSVSFGLVPGRRLVPLLPGSVAHQLSSIAAKIRDSCLSKWVQILGSRTTGVG